MSGITEADVAAERKIPGVISDGESETNRSRPDLQLLESIQRRVLWLATRIIDYANRERPNPDGLKVGGHQASSASMVSLMTALWFCHLRGHDRVSVKPHASPVLHALWYLAGQLDRAYLTQLRSYGGLQAYPSRTKDPDRIDFSTGSVGHGAVAPLFAAVTARYLRSHDLAPVPREADPPRFIALIGDAELDEGNVWEAVADPITDGVSDVLWVVDLNRQSLDRVIPGIKVARWRAMFEANGWNVIDAKYGRRLESAFGRRGGEALRQHIDAMSNEAYQSLFTLPSAMARERFLENADLAVQRLTDDFDDDHLQSLVTDLGGHDLATLIDAYAAGEGQGDRPSVVFAYTIKGWGLPIAGHPLNHSALLTQEQVEILRRNTGLAASDEWDPFPADSPEGRWCTEVGQRLQPPPIPETAALNIPTTLDIRHRTRTSTQDAFGRIMTRLADVEGISDRLVTTSPDVAISTSLGGWINKRGVFSPAERRDYLNGRELLQWRPAPNGQHLELDISEMNLFALLGQLGLSRELSGALLLPIGTVYDPFICRGLDALIYALYSGAKFILVGTPSGVSLSPEGGAHQSTVTPSLGLELPGIDTVEPAFATALEWLLCEALERMNDREGGRSTYFRLTTKPIDQSPFERLRAEEGDDSLRADVIAGGYLLQRADPAAEHTVNLLAAGAVVPQVIEAADELEGEGVGVNVVVVTSADRLHREWVTASHRSVRRAAVGREQLHIARLLRGHRTAPTVTAHDASPHAMSWLGSVFGTPVVPLGVDDFGQSGALRDIHDHYGLSAGHVVNAALLALVRAGV